MNEGRKYIFSFRKKIILFTMLSNNYMFFNRHYMRIEII